MLNAEPMEKVERQVKVFIKNLAIFFQQAVSADIIQIHVLEISP
jgi:hypothetical protein